ncbi:hypothetical protein EJB05_16199 [Eragrostis curvula]|uniref:Uncharacterized protein n=1 Tax=Eragrostis curvula TaxID=38414 RepID=A0A5J9VG03_9POAL|nr:hypothetical protein EJB05_16199 [Eragrostis curvula]
MTGMAAGGRAVAAAVMAVALLAGGADADCFDYCFKNCIANDKSMADYCNYACGKTCEPGQRALPDAAGVQGLLPIRCQIDCVRRNCHGFRIDRQVTVDCYHSCFDGCETKTVPRPLRAGAAVDAADSGPVSETTRGDAVGPASEPDPYRYDAARPASVPDHPFHEEKQDAVQPVSVPDHP